MELKFTKMQGLGNDFVVIDAINQKVSLPPEKIKSIADRHFGIGCDQILLVESAHGSHADFRYRIFNADGSEVAQCGNGARCFARYVLDYALTNKREIQVDTDAGRLVLTVVNEELVTVNMGIPRLSPKEIPMVGVEEAHTYCIDLDGQMVSFGAVSMGNPHAVITVEDVETAPVSSLGPILESHAVFPERANIGFMQIIEPQAIKLRVFERGSGETLACGSGACAAVVIGIESGCLNSPVKVSLPGGSLQISWSGRGSPVMMTGPAIKVFDGVIQI